MLECDLFITTGSTLGYTTKIRKLESEVAGKQREIERLESICQYNNTRISERDLERLILRQENDELKSKIEEFEDKDNELSEMVCCLRGAVERQHLENETLRAKLWKDEEAVPLDDMLNNPFISAKINSLEVDIKRLKNTDWGKKYHKVIAKLEKITNKKPF